MMITRKCGARYVGVCHCGRSRLLTNVDKSIPARRLDRPVRLYVQVPWLIQRLSLLIRVREDVIYGSHSRCIACTRATQKLSVIFLPIRMISRSRLLESIHYQSQLVQVNRISIDDRRIVDQS